jgi:hypothetical protein
MTTISTESSIMSIITETVLENSSADLSVEFDSQPDYTTFPEPIMPPQPPGDDNFIPGEFKYINSKHSRNMLQNAYQAINQTETWNFVKKDIESFSFSNTTEIKLISNKMTELGYYGHSGVSFGWTMRQMQFIAKNGEEAFKIIAEKW